jgi:hypothetical protein
MYAADCRSAIRDGEKPRAVGVVYTDLNGVEHKALLNGETSGGSEVFCQLVHWEVHSCYC